MKVYITFFDSIDSCFVCRSVSIYEENVHLFDKDCHEFACFSVESVKNLSVYGD